jgi:hypothetical protein
LAVVARARTVRRWLLRGHLVGLTGAVLLTATLALRPPPQTAAPEDAPAQGWVVINRPFELFAADLHGAAQVDHGYSATRHVEGGGRRDILAVGHIGETSAMLVQFYRLGSEAAPASTLYVETARRASEARYWVERVGPVDALTTRFGAFEVADVAIKQGDRAQHCLAFRLADSEATERTLRVSGLSCGARGVAPARAELACQLDRLQLVAAGDDVDLRQIFVEAERRRDESCAAPRLAGASPNQRPSWLEKTGAPELRKTASAAPQRPAQMAQATNRRQAR